MSTDALTNELIEFVRNVREMRDHQTSYFRTRDRRALNMAVEAEKKIDREIQRFEQMDFLEQL